MKQTFYTSDYSRLPLRELAVLIAQDYHSSLKEAIDTVLVHLDTAYSIHSSDKKLVRIRALASRIREMFVEHAEKEERLLFPMLLADTDKRFTGRDIQEFRLFLGELKAEHRRLGEEFTNVRDLTNNYNFEASASPSEKLAYARLNEFEQDLNRLFYIEEEFLFPRIQAINQKNNIRPS